MPDYRRAKTGLPPRPTGKVTGIGVLANGSIERLASPGALPDAAGPWETSHGDKWSLDTSKWKPLKWHSG